MWIQSSVLVFLRCEEKDNEKPTCLIEDDYNVYMTNLPAIQNAVDQTFINDLSDIIHQYLQPNCEGKGIFELIVKDGTIWYNGWDLWITVLVDGSRFLQTTFKYYEPEWVLQDMEQAYKNENEN